MWHGTEAGPNNDALTIARSLPVLFCSTEPPFHLSHQYTHIQTNKERIAERTQPSLLSWTNRKNYRKGEWSTSETLLLSERSTTVEVSRYKYKQIYILIHSETRIKQRTGSGWPKQRSTTHRALAAVDNRAPSSARLWQHVGGLFYRTDLTLPVNEDY